MTFDEVGAPARLSGGPSPATNIPVVHTYGNTSDHPRPKIVQIGPVVQALEQFSRMQSERKQTLE